MGDPNGFPGSWFGPKHDLVSATICRVKQEMEDLSLSFPSPVLCFSACQINKYIFTQRKDKVLEDTEGEGSLIYKEKL